MMAEGKVRTRRTPATAVIAIVTTIAVATSLVATAAAAELSYVKASLESNAAGDCTTLKLMFKTVNPLEKGGVVNITFPEGFNVSKVCLERAICCTFDKVCVDAANRTLSLRTAESIPAKVKCVLTLRNVKNPLTPGEYTLVVATFKNGTIDGPTHSVTIKIKVPPSMSLALASITSKLMMLLDTLVNSVPESAAGNIGNAVSELLRLLDSFMRTLQKM
ncbi:MAG: hypothetical protein DRJ03_29535 [Chloroflexi bacterium]|nr:MAG: hypothetical protein DRJ03_29535 [Chloroflexota bacterium]